MIASKYQMRCIQRAVIIAVCFFGPCIVGYTDVILDTGPITGMSEKVLVKTSWEAHQFSVPKPTVVTSLEGFMYGGRPNTEPPGDVTAAIYSNGQSGLPAARLHEQRFSVPNTTSENVGWHGVSNVSWSLEPGTYWAVFAIEDDELFHALMPFNDSGGEVWAIRTDPSMVGEPPVEPRWVLGTEGDNLGFRLTGTVVPEPSSTSMATLLALFGLRRTLDAAQCEVHR